jgi:hypothetical protein
MSDATLHHAASGCPARSAVSDKSALDNDATRLAVLISRPQRHHRVEIDHLVMPVEKLASSQR